MHLTEPLDVTPADESTPEIEERLMYVVAPLVAYFQTSVAIEPRERPFHNPPVASQPLARFDTPPCYPRGYAPLPECFAAASEIVGLVGTQLLGALARSAPTRSTGSMASTASSKTLESWTLAAERITASGTPPRSQTTWRLEPCLPLSVGFLPVFLPPRGRPR